MQMVPVPVWFAALPIFAAGIPILFFVMYWLSIKKNAPEAIVFKEARRLRQKNVPVAIIRMVHGDNAVMYGLGRKRAKGDEITFHIKQYGIKFDSTQLTVEGDVEHTFDGVPIMNCSPTQPYGVDGNSAISVDMMFKGIREEYPQLNFLPDLVIATLLTKDDHELEHDARLFLDRKKTDLTHSDLVETIKTIKEQYKDVQIRSVLPKLEFFTYKRALSVINNAFSSQLLQQFEMLVKRLQMESANKFGAENLIKYAFAFAIIAIGGAIAIKFSGLG